MHKTRCIEHNNQSLVSFVSVATRVHCNHHEHVEVLTECDPIVKSASGSSGCRQPPVAPVDGQTHCLRHHSLQWGMDQSVKPLDP